MLALILNLREVNLVKPCFLFMTQLDLVMVVSFLGCGVFYLSISNCVKASASVYIARETELRKSNPWLFLHVLLS